MSVQVLVCTLNNDIFPFYIQVLSPASCLIKEWVSFFLGSWEMNRSADKQIAWTAKRFSCDLFVPHCDSFPMNREKKDTHSLYFQCLQQKSLLKFSERSKKFKFPSEIGNMTLFPDKRIHACHTTSIPSGGPPSAPLTNQNTDRKTRTTRIERWPWHC